VITPDTFIPQMYYLFVALFLYYYIIIRFKSYYLFANSAFKNAFCDYAIFQIIYCTKSFREFKLFIDL